MGKWNTQDLDQLNRLVGEGKSDSVISGIMKRSIGAVEHQTRGMRSRQHHRIMSSVFKPHISNQVPNTLIEALNNRLSAIKPYKLKNDDFKTTKKGDTLVIHLTDLHAGKIVKDQNSDTIYDETIFRTRMDKLCRQILKLLDNNISKGVPVTDVVIISTGDLANGEDIYETQAYEQELAPPNQVMLCVEVIIGLILSLVERKLHVSFYGVKGNHGRTGKDTDPSSNWDSMIYKILEFWADASKLKGKVKICYAEDTDSLTFNIRGHNYLIRHRAPETTDTASGRSKFSTWAHKRNAHAIVYGHFHHFGITDVDGIRVFRGGSTVGGDSLSDSMAKYSEPIQLVWGVTDDRIHTFMYAVDLN